MAKTRIILADDHLLLTDAIKTLLEPEYEVVGMFCDGACMIEAAPALQPDIAELAPTAWKREKGSPS